MPELIRLYLRQVAVGFALSAVLVGLLLWFDVARLWSLVSHSDAGLLAVFLLWLFNGIVLGAVQFGIRVMALAEPEEDGPGGPSRPEVIPDPAFMPVPVAVPPQGRPRG